MKTEQLIVQYLYQNKEVALQDIGTFTLSPDVNIPSLNEKDTPLPPDAIHFVCDPKTAPDEGLIKYIMEHTRKIRPLATSDLESFIMLNTQFLNIGKPLVLEGMGTLQKTQAGDYAFAQAGQSHVVHEDLPKAVTEKQKEQISFATPPREKQSSGSKAGLWLVLLLIIGGGAFAAYYFLYVKKQPVTDNSATTVLTRDSTNTGDTAAASKTEKPLVPAPVSDSNTFYIVLKQFDNLPAAEKSRARFASFGNNVLLKTDDSLSYRLRMPFIKPLSDTARVNDSLTKFFGTKTYVQLP